MTKSIFWFMRISLYAIVLSVLSSDNFLVPTHRDALRAMQQPLPPKKASEQQNNRVQGSTKIQPQPVKREVSTQPDALQKTKAVYQCRESNGQTIFSDQPCGDIQRVTHFKHRKPNIADTFHRVTQKDLPQKTGKTSQSSPRNRNPADRQEINTRYDNLSRVIHYLLKDDRGRLNHYLITLNEDRREALSMYATSSDSYSINQRFDNLRRDIRRQENQRNRARIVRQLLRLERQRNRELYNSH